MSFFYIVSKLFTYLILPPGIFIVILFAASIYAKRYKKFFLFSAIVFYLLSNTVISNILLSPLEKPYAKPSNIKDADMVVVLGGGRIKGSSNLPLSQSAFKRVMWGLMIAKQKNLPLLFSGGGIDTKFSEADAFIQTLNELSKYLKIKIDKKQILIEDKSLNSFENAKYTKKILQRRGVLNPKIILVTSACHMKRAIKLYRYFGIKVVPSATDFLINQKKYNFFDMLPHMGALKRSYMALHEYFGILSLYLKLK